MPHSGGSIDMRTIMSYPKTSRHRRRGAVLLLFAICLVALMGLAALAVDLGAVYSARTQLQSGADAAALAGIASLETGEHVAAATQFAGLNCVMNQSITLAPTDVTTGKLDFATGTFSEGSAPANAVRVTARRTADSPDGPLGLFFGRVIGYDSVPISTESVAALDRRVNGVQPASGDGQFDLVPFTVKKEEVGHIEDLAGNNLDEVDFEIDTETGTIIVNERVDARFQVLGTQITYGAGGPVIGVYPSISIDG
ncbi:MAG: hypothetical protein E4H18_04355, partial [Hyphomicrobiales bacterium]